MGIWKGTYRGIPLGWDSPVRPVVNPAFVNLNDRKGLGWLSGFNEWLCRCGLAYNGPPGEDAGGTPITLHGRIANLPAHRVEIAADSAGDGLLSVTGVVDEASMFGPCLRLTSRMETALNSHRLVIVDTVTNLGGQPAELELLYHTNIGKPFLDAGGQVVAPALEVVPRDQRAVEGVGHWNTYSAPEAGYAEQVYFLKLAASAKRETEVLLRNAKGDRGMSLSFSLDHLPHFTVWKNTASEADGYVTGLEPATNLPNFKAFERQQGRVISLKPNEDYEARLEIAVYDSPAMVKEAETRIQKLLGGKSPIVRSGTQPGWSPGK
jgi:galactose mutarotase-like enzyme